MTSLAWNLPRVQPVWRLPFAAVVALVLLVLVRYHTTAAAMVEIWTRSATFQHAFVVPPIAAWLIWRKRAQLQQIEPRSSPWVLLPMAVLAAVWWVADRVSVNAGTQLALTTMLVATVPLVLGWQVTRALAFPLAFLFFAVPIGEFATPTLMHWTAEVLVASLRLTGIPVHQEGQQLVIPSGRWAVVEACGGIRYLMSSFMVGTLFAYLNYTSTKRRLIFVGMSILVPIVANWVRAYIIVMLGHLSNNEIATGVDHLVYGWVFFGIVIMALFFIGARWAEPEAPPVTTAESDAAMRSTTQAPAALAWWPFGVVMLGLLAVQWPWWLQPSDDPGRTTAVTLQLPDSLGAWRAQAESVSDWSPEFEGAKLQRARTYLGPEGAAVSVHLSYYRDQGDGAKVVSSNNAILRSSNHAWVLLSPGRRQISAAEPSIWRTATLLAAEGNNSSNGVRPRVAVWQSYWIAERWIDDDVRAKLWQGWNAVLGEPDDAAAVHLSTVANDDAEAQRHLAAFVSENLGPLQRVLSAARASR